MKIYNKKFFIWGIIFFIPLPLFVLGVIEADLLQWFLAVGLSAKFLYAGLSKEESKRQADIRKNYGRVSHQLFGKYAWIKTNLPWIITVAFFTVTLLIRFVLDRIIPVWIVVCFVIALAICVFYSIGLDREITEQIDKERNPGSEADT